MVKMKELPKSDRPRERLILEGVENLSNEELLSILLGSGVAGDSVKGVAVNLLKATGGVSNLKEFTYQQLLQIRGIGMAKACILLASIELGKRMKRPELERVRITNPEILYHYYREVFASKKQEYFYCVYLDNHKRLIKEKLLFMGTLNQSLVHPREIFKEACLVSASSIICIHNHPGNQLIPSREDLELTKRLVSLGRLLGIPIDDHIIIGSSGYYSFFEHNEI